MVKNINLCMFTVLLFLADAFLLWAEELPVEPVTSRPQVTDLAVLSLGAGLEGFSYYEFPSQGAIDYSSSYSGSFVTAATVVVRWKQVGLQLRGNLGPVMLGGREQWISGSSTLQRNDLSYRLVRGVAAVGVVLPNGMEPYLGFWYAKGTQVRENFSPPDPLFPDLVAVERIWSRGLVVGFQGVYHESPKNNVMRFYGDLMIVPNLGSLRATTTNTYTNNNLCLPDLKLSSWGVGFQGGGSYGWTFGKGPRKALASISGNFLALYYNGKVRRGLLGCDPADPSIPVVWNVEWPRNLTMGWSFMIEFGGGWFSLFKSALQDSATVGTRGGGEF